MNITVMVGNGFDINCGMKCTYRDVYKEYVTASSATDVIAAFKKRIRSDLDTWADFETAMAADMVNYQSEREFLSCLRDFKRHLNGHLLLEQSKLLQKLQDPFVYAAVQEEMRDSLESFYDGISHNISHDIEESMKQSPNSYRVISFNYTDIFEHVLRYVIKFGSGRIVHIHGKLNDDLVLGMDCLEQLPAASYELSNKGKRAFIKGMFNQAFDQARVALAAELIQTSDIICVYGMSLGISDLTWKNALLDWFRTSHSMHLFLYNYACSCLSYETVDERLDLEDDAKMDILSRLGVKEEDREQYLHKLHIPCGKNIFNIASAINKGLIAQKEHEEEMQAIRTAAVGSLR